MGSNILFLKLTFHMNKTFNKNLQKMHINFAVLYQS